MSLIPMIGYRAAYTRKEVEQFTGLTKSQIARAVRTGQLKKRGLNPFFYLQKDVNEFLTRINTGSRHKFKLTKAKKKLPDLGPPPAPSAAEVDARTLSKFGLYLRRFR